MGGKSAKHSGYSSEEIRENEGIRRDAQPMTVSCALCNWKGYSGTAADARQASHEHRALKHPETLVWKKQKSIKHILSYRRPEMSDEEKALIEYERRKRARLAGIENEIN